jgi:hypothetical protein
MLNPIREMTISEPYRVNHAKCTRVTIPVEPVELTRVVLQNALGPGPDLFGHQKRSLVS